MSKYRSKRVSVCLDAETYAKAEAMAKAIGARTMSKAVAAIVRAMARLMAGERPDQEDAPPSEVEQMFAELSDWEPRPEPGHAPKRRRHSNG